MPPLDQAPLGRKLRIRELENIFQKEKMEETFFIEIFHFHIFKTIGEKPKLQLAPLLGLEPWGYCVATKIEPLKGLFFIA